MTKRQKQALALGGVALILYLSGYAWARATHRIVHLENRTHGENQIVASRDEWDDLLVSMSEGKPGMGAYARGRKRAVDLLNAVFWPLRTLEAAYWNAGE